MNVDQCNKRGQYISVIAAKTLLLCYDTVAQEC